MSELFNIGFLTVSIIDLIDVAIVTVLFYWIYNELKHTIAIQILFGLVILLGLSFITEAFNLKSMNWILTILSEIWLLAFIILFQPELRKLLLMVTRLQVFQIFIKTKISETLDEVIEATISFSEKHIGALMVFPRNQNVQMAIETGITLNANVSKELLTSIFVLKSPLHDGAVIINNQTIIAARCILPLANTEKYKGKNLGTRHRAALGLSEQIDVVVLIVSEETGWISIADRGELTLNIPKEELNEVLRNRLYEQN